MNCAVPLIKVLFALYLLLLAGISGGVILWRGYEGTSSGTLAKPGTVLLCVLFVVSTFYGLAILEELSSSLAN
jgi:hypothetical protein